MTYHMVFYDSRLWREFLRQELEITESTTISHLSKQISDIIAGINQTFMAEVVDADGEVVFGLESTATTGGYLYRENIPLTLELAQGDKVETKYLQLVNPEVNNNKFYRMVDNSDGTFTAYYGRNGSGIKVAGNRSATYPLIMFYIKYIEKVQKGYRDLSEQIDENIATLRDVKTITQTADKYAKIENEKIARVVEYLQSVSRQYVSQSYEITPVMVSDQMIITARKLLQSLYEQTDINSFNKVLVDIFMTIPRRMERVSDHIAKKDDDMARILKSEDDLLSNMELQRQIQSQNEVNKLPITILEHFGLEMYEATEDDIKKVQNLLINTSLSNKVSSVFQVINNKTRNAFEKYCQDNDINDDGCKLLWHGSRSENWLSIMANGLVLNPNAQITGKMFGNGIYFAPSAEKSFGYTSAWGSYWANGTDSVSYMGVYDTAYGNPLYPDDISHFSDYESFKRYAPDKHCLHARRGVGALRNEEIVFYSESQVDIKYLVEFHS